jgi:hypothetical protein
MTEDLTEMREELDFLEAICDDNVSLPSEDVLAASSESSDISECESDLQLQNELNTLIRRTITTAAGSKTEPASGQEDSVRKNSIQEESHALQMMINESQAAETIPGRVVATGEHFLQKGTIGV